MSRQRDDWDDDRGGRGRDDDDRGRGRDDYDDRGRGGYRDDYDDRGSRGGPRSGAVTAAGIMTIIVGSLVLFFAACLLIGGAAASEVGAFADVGGAIKFMGMMAIINGLVGMGVAGCGIPGGIGILMRKSWGRLLGIISASLAGLMGVLEIVRIAGGFLRLPSGWPGKGIGITIAMIDFLILAAFAVVILVLLLGGSRSREFR